MQNDSILFLLNVQKTVNRFARNHTKIIINAKPKYPAEKASIFDSKASAMDTSKPEVDNEATIAAMVQKPTQQQIYKHKLNIQARQNQKLT
jgi:hypothetical protein